MKHKQLKNYVSPTVELAELALEQGIAVSGDDMFNYNGDYIGGWNDEEEL